MKSIFSWNLIPDNTEYLAKTTVVNKDLDLRLKDVYVTSKGLVSKRLLLLLFILEIRSIIDKVKHFYNFDCRQKISNRTKHCHWRDGLNSKHSATKNLIKFHWGRCHYFKPSISLQNIKQNPTEWTVDKIAEENKIKLNVASTYTFNYAVSLVFH